MDFGIRIPKPEGMTGGLFGWESAGLRRRLEEERNAAKPKGVDGLKTNPPRGISLADMAMKERDQPKGVGLRKTTGMAVEEGDFGSEKPWVPEQVAGYGPWVEWGYKGEVPRGVGAVCFRQERFEQKLNAYPEAPYFEEMRWTFRGWRCDIVAYCLKDPE